MSKTNAEEAVELNKLAGAYIALLTQMTDPDDPSTWVELAHANYARQQNVSISSITQVAGKSTCTWPHTAALTFGQWVAGGSVVGWAAIPTLAGALSTAIRTPDSAFSLTVAANGTPKIDVDAITSTEA